MRTRLRRTLVGGGAGVLAGLAAGISGAALISGSVLSVLGGTEQPVLAWIVHVLASAVLGVGYALLFGRQDRPVGSAEMVAGGLLYGGLGWGLLILNMIPLLTGKGVQWQASGAMAAIPALPVYLLMGVGLAAVYPMLSRRFEMSPVSEDDSTAEVPARTQRRIVVLGGGFAGVDTARHLERLFARDHDMEIMLVSNTNHLLFTPMLAEVTASGVEGQHISPALRGFFHHARVIRGEPVSVDIHERVVTIDAGTSIRRAFSFDHLVLALGSVPNFFGNRNLERHTFTFKTLADAIQIRNHVIEQLERADTESDPARRRAMLTFVVVGGGFAGAELVGGLNDFIRGSLWYFPHIPAADVSIILIHPGERILPELSESLALYAQEKMAARGVLIKIRTRVVDAAPGKVMTDHNEIATRTVIWTAGNLPHPLLQTLGIELNQRGAAVTDDTLRVKGQTVVWAVGDCAQIPDVLTGKAAPPTAQFATREAKTLALNIHAAVNGKPLKQLRFKPLGALAVLGHRTATAEVRGFKFSGLLAWLMWRGIYLVKLPGLEKRVRVLLDWIVDIFFPRDLVYYQFPVQKPLIDDMDKEGGAS